MFFTYRKSRYKKIYEGKNVWTKVVIYKSECYNNNIFSSRIAMVNDDSERKDDVLLDNTIAKYS